MDHPSGAGKIFLGGISPNTTKESIIEYFGQYGKIIDAVAMFQNGKPRCFGFVTFEDPAVASEVLRVSHELDGHNVDMKLAVPKGEGGNPAPQGAPLAQGRPPMPDRTPRPQATDKVFVGGLSAETTTEVLQMYFGQYGTLIDSVVMKDKITGKPKGFGFVQYDNTDSVETVMQEYESHQIDGKWVEVKRAVPKDKCAPAQSPGGFGGGGFKGGGGFQGGGKGGYHDRGPPPMGKGGYHGGGGGGYGESHYPVGGFGGRAPAPSYGRAPPPMYGDRAPYGGAPPRYNGPQPSFNHNPRQFHSFDAGVPGPAPSSYGQPPMPRYGPNAGGGGGGYGGKAGGKGGKHYAPY